MQSEAQLLHQRGPAWTPSGLDIRGGRFPLSVEAHLLTMTANLLPGVTTVTTNARYYAVHGLVAVEAAEQDLDMTASVELLRRCEVVFGAAARRAATRGRSTPHGASRLDEAMADGEIDIDAASKPGRSGYSESSRGFWGQYIGSEITLGILDPLEVNRPGPRSDSRRLRTGLSGLVEASRKSRLTVSELDELNHLALHAGGTEDGQWLLELLTRPSVAVETLARPDEIRRSTIDLLIAAIDHHPSPSFAEAFRHFVVFSEGTADDPRTSGLAEAEAWRGVVLRSYSVGAWRRFWQWLVAQMEGRGITPAELAAECASHFSTTTVEQFVADLPPLIDGPTPLPAEDAIRASSEPVPVKEIRILLAGAQRADQLSGKTHDVFVGRRTVLGPEWVRDGAADANSRQIREYVSDLVHEVVQRSQRIAMKKARIDPQTGRLTIPTRVYEREGLLIRTGPEGGDDVGLRIDQLGGVLADLGVFEWSDEGWRTTDLAVDLP